MFQSFIFFFIIIIIIISLPCSFRTIKKKDAETLREERGAETLWNVLEGEVVGKKTKEGNKEKKRNGTCVEEKKRGKKKEGNMDKKIK